jgi:internalin A
LAELNHLQRLHCYNCIIDAWSAELWQSPALRRVSASELAGMPMDLLSKNTGDNCLPAIHAHLDDLGDDPERLTDVELTVLGNGRIDKTQIVNRLRGEDFEEDANSTYGVSIVQAPIPGAENESFNIWDFGGQDIYFGTHMLFLKSRAVFMLVWTPESYDADTHDHGGMIFRNQPVAWWLDCIRRFGNERAPLIVVQNQLDIDGDRGDHPAVAETRKKWKHCRSVAYSAKTDEGRGTLDDHLKHAAKRFNPPLIGKGRLAVMRTLQEWREADQKRAAQDKRHRILTFNAFESLREKTGGVSDPVQFFHNTGQVFWRENLF